MRMLTIIASLLFFASCASNQHHDHETREPASVQSPCKIEKHSKNDWYRLTVHGKPAFKSWYTESQVQGHLDSYTKKGFCK